MTDKIQALAKSIAEEFGAITVGGHGDTRGEYTVVDASPEEVARFLAPRLIQPEWISADERCPEGNGRYLARFRTGYICTQEWYWHDWVGLPLGASITHWAQLPIGPEVKP